MKNFGQVVDPKDLVTKEYVDNNTHTTHDISDVTDISTDNVYSGDHKINQLMYFKNNNINNISHVYTSGFYGTKNTDSTTPYAGYWFVAVFCKDPVNQIAVQWAMNVGKTHNGELWMRTVRLNAPTTGDGNMVGTWERIINDSLLGTMLDAYVTSDYFTEVTSSKLEASDLNEVSNLELLNLWNTYIE